LVSGGGKKYKEQIRVSVCALLWGIWNTRNDFIFNNTKIFIFHAGYTAGYLLDLYVVIPITNREAQEFGNLVQTAREGCAWFMQLVYLAF
jgi:hypothetical protein